MSYIEPFFSFLSLYRLHLLRGLLHRCLTVTLQKCFLTYQTSPNFPLAWGWVDTVWTFTLGRTVHLRTCRHPSMSKFRQTCYTLLSTTTDKTSRGSIFLEEWCSSHQWTSRNYNIYPGCSRGLKWFNILVNVSFLLFCHHFYKQKPDIPTPKKHIPLLYWFILQGQVMLMWKAGY